MKNAVVRALVLSSVAGCATQPDGSGTDGTATVSGTIAGTSLHVDGAIAAVASDVDGDTGTTILLMSGADACARVGGSLAPGDTQITLSLAVPDATGAHFTAIAAPGTFSIAPDVGAVDAQVDRYDATCQRVATSGARAQSGSITLDAVSSTGASGSFAITLGTGDAITGTFTATTCEALTSVLDADRAVGSCTP